MKSQYRRSVFHLLPLLFASGWSFFQTQFWPILPLGFGLTLLFLLYDSSWLNLQSVIIESIIAGFLYRSTIWISTLSMIGMDPDKYAVAIQAVSEGGIKSISILGFYGSLPVFHVLHAVLLEVTGLSPATVLQLVATLLFSTVPVFTVAYLGREVSGDRAGKSGAILAASGTASTVYATLTIPQGTMLILWYFVGSILILGGREPLRTLALVLLIALMAGLHKLGALLALGAIVAVAAVNFIGAVRDDRVLLPQNLLHYVLIAGLIFALQMVWLTEWVKGIALKISLLFTTNPAETVEPPAAATKIGGLDILLLEHGSWIVLLLGAAVVGVWFVFSRTDRQTAGLVGIVGLSAVIIGAAVTTPFSLSVQRAIGIGEPFFILLIVIGAVVASKRTDRRVAPMVVGLLLITQLGTAGAVPDHPLEVRDYLTESEVEAKEWANAHMDQEIYGNYFVSQEIIDYDGGRATFITGEGGGFPDGWSPASRYLAGGNLTAADGCFFLRKSQQKVRYNGLYRLDYNPVSWLSRSNRTLVFQNSNVVIYC